MEQVSVLGSNSAINSSPCPWPSHSGRSGFYGDTGIHQWLRHEHGSLRAAYPKLSSGRDQLTNIWGQSPNQQDSSRVLVSPFRALCENLLQCWILCHTTSVHIFFLLYSKATGNLVYMVYKVFTSLLPYLCISLSIQMGAQWLIVIGHIQNSCRPLPPNIFQDTDHGFTLSSFKNELCHEQN